MSVMGIFRQQPHGLRVADLPNDLSDTCTVGRYSESISEGTASPCGATIRPYGHPAPDSALNARSQVNYCWIVSRISVVWLRLLYVPVTVILYVPGFAISFRVAHRVSVLVEVVGLGLKDQDVPCGTPLRLSVTA